MNLIVAVDENWGIGKEGEMLFHIPADLKYFRRMTEGKTVVMGRTTLESFPGHKPLKNRRNIVLTRNPDFSAEGVEIVRSVDEALAAIRSLPEDEVFIVGGQQVYEQFLPYCRTAYVTRIEAAADSDRFFPDLDRASDWHRVAPKPEVQQDNGLWFRWLRYDHAGE